MAYDASPIKRRRRTKSEMDTIRAAIYETVSTEAPMTVRQVFYRLVTQGVIEKTEMEYNKTVCRLLTQMRLDSDIPFRWIADNSRWMRKPETHSSLEEMLEITASTYRRAMWTNQPERVEIWLEKEALSGVLYNVTAQWDVPLMVTRGYPSLSFLYEASEAIDDADQPTYLYYLGDWDPSGLDIARNVEERLNEFSCGEIHFKRIAITPEQVDKWNLQTRPTKRSDSRSGGFGGESVELDAIPPNELRKLVRDHIEKHIDRDALEKLQVAEESERELLTNWEDALNDIRI